MDIITGMPGMDYQNGHYAITLGALHVFYFLKMYLCSHKFAYNKINPSIAKLTSLVVRVAQWWGPG